jgi:hypothetical protein
VNPPVARPPDPIEDILRRIARVESGGLGGYAARGPAIARGAYRGQRAAGKYQVMPGNIPAWSREALGREVSLDEFLASPEIQERIARHRVSSLYDRYGNAADVASVWHSGRPLSQARGARDQNMSTREYVRRVTGTSQDSMDPELDRLERALRAAHRAGDVEAARRLAAALVERRGSASPAPSQARSAPPILLDENGQPPAVAAPADAAAGAYLSWRRNGASHEHAVGESGIREVTPALLAEGEAAAERFMAEAGGAPADDAVNTIRTRASYDPEQPGESAADSSFAPIQAKLARGEPLTEEDARRLGYASAEEANADVERERARVRGRESVRPEDREGLNLGAAVQGFGSGFFGVGTPATAVGEMIVSRLDREPGASSWGESLEFARGRRDQLRESHPEEFYTGMAGSLVSGVGAMRGLGIAGRAAMPRAASVFTMQSGQTARNIARLAAAGAGAAGVTALNEEGADAVPGSMAAGAVAGPALAGAASVAGAGARAVTGRIRPDNAAIRLLAKRLGEPVDALQQRYDDFVQTHGRPPRLVEIVRRETSEELGQISRARSEAGGIFRQAEEDAARALPDELAPLVRGGGAVGSEPAAAARRAATTRAAAEVVGRRVQSTEPAQLGRRDVSMDRAMARIGSHRVPITDEMLEVVEHQDVWNSLDPAVRRRLRATIDAAGEEGTPYLTVANWDMIRQDLAKRGAGPGAGTIYARLRDRVRDYVSDAVPEYGAALRGFGRRSDTARGTVEGQRVLTLSTREFADRLRTAGGGTVEQAQRPATRTAEQAGMRVGARTTLANVLGGEPAKAERLMARLARDAGMRERVRLVLRDDEAAELERLAERYGHQLDFSAGLRTGRSVVRQSDTEAFQEAVAQAGNVERTGVRQGARAALTEAAGESPAGAARTALRMAEDPGLQTRIATALGAGEQRRLATLGQSVVESSRRLAEAAPGGASLAATRAQENAEGIQRVIQASVVATGRFSGGFIGNFVNAIVQRTRLSRAAARRLAELATDPARAHMVIARLRRAGVESEAILRMYQDAAAAAGILAGQASDGQEPMIPER